MRSLSESYDSLFTSPTDGDEQHLNTASSIYSLYCRLTLGLRNAESWDCVYVHREAIPIFNTELTREMSSSKCAVDICGIATSCYCHGSTFFVINQLQGNLIWSAF